MVHRAIAAPFDPTNPEDVHRLAQACEAMSQLLRAYTATLPVRGVDDPHFPQWNGEQHTVEQWLDTLDCIKALQALPEHVAIGYAKLAMPVQNRDAFRLYAPTITWDQFKQVCKQTYKPRHQRLVLRAWVVAFSSV